MVLSYTAARGQNDKNFRTLNPKMNEKNVAVRVIFHNFGILQEDCCIENEVLRKKKKKNVYLFRIG